MITRGIDRDLWPAYRECLEKRHRGDCAKCQGCPMQEAIYRQGSDMSLFEWQVIHELAMQFEINKLERQLRVMKEREEARRERERRGSEPVEGAL